MPADTRAGAPAGAPAIAPIVRFLPCWVVRPRTFLLAVQAALTVAMVSFASWAVVRSAGTMDTSIGLVLGLTGCQIVLVLTGIGKTIADRNPMGFIRGILGSLLVGVAVTFVLFEAMPNFSKGNSGVPLAWLLSIAFAVALRPVLRALVRGHWLIQTTMIYGSDDRAENLYRELATGDTAVGGSVTAVDDAMDDKDRKMSDRHMSRIVVTDPQMTNGGEFAEILLDSKMRGLRIEPAVDSCEKMCRKIWIAGLEPEWLIYSAGFAPSRFCRLAKWVVDSLGAMIAVVLVSPVLAVTALLIKMTSPGPVFYRQERVGQYGKSFNVIKFRSMFVDAESKSGPTWAAANDNRITPIGKIMRKCRIDELPQLFNVLKGEMSFVGPRPERPYFVDILKKEIPYYDVRHYVRPGITGWAQVMYRYGASVHDAYEKLQYDLYYTKHISVLLDLKILVKTMKVVLTGGGR